MGLLRAFCITFLLAAALLTASCGGSSATLNDEFQQWAAAQDFSSSLGDGTNGLPAIPQDIGEVPHGVSNEPPDTLVKWGADYLQKLNAEVDGDFLVLDAPGEDAGRDVAYGLYKVEGLLERRPVLMNFDCLPDRIDEPYYVGLADYTVGNWMWFGPIFTPEYELDLSEINHQFVTHLGNMYFLVVCPPATGATLHKTTLFFGAPGEGDLPGAPHHLIASDGEFAAAVGLVWQPGANAGHYEIWRKGGGEPFGPDGQDNGEWYWLAASEIAEYLDQDVAPGVVYGYKVRAVNPGGMSGWSNIDTGFAGEGPPPPDGFVIEGHIAFHGNDAAQPGDPCPGVLVKLLGLPDIRAAETDQAGNFRFGDLPAGRYTVVPMAPDKVFDPWYRVVELGPDHPAAEANFLATMEELTCWRVWGFAFTQNVDGVAGMHPMPGVVMTISAGDHTFTVETNQDGYFVQTDLPAGAYLIVPGKDGFVFEPSAVEGIIDGEHVQPPAFFRGFPQGDPPPPDGTGVIEGSVIYHGDPMGEGTPLPECDILLLGLRDEVWGMTNVDGAFRFGELPFGTYIVMAYHPYKAFEPHYVRLVLNAEHPAGLAQFNAFPTDAYYRLFGFTYSFQADTPNGFMPLGGTPVSLQRFVEGAPVGEPIVVETNQDGFYQRFELETGGYLVTPHRDGYGFWPEMQDAHVDGQHVVEPLNFVGEALVP